jgi:hypothetical protein
MLGQAQALGCSNTDAACLCRNVNFGYGVRDCSNQACPDQNAVSSVISYGLAYCASGEHIQVGFSYAVTDLL